MIFCKSVFVFVIAFLFAVCERPPAPRNAGPDRPANSLSINKKAKTVIIPTPNAASAPADLRFLDTEAALFRQVIETSMLAETRTQTTAIKSLAKQMAEESRTLLDKISNTRSAIYPGQPLAINGEIPEVEKLIQLLENSNIEGLKASEFDIAFTEFSKSALAAINAAAGVTVSSEVRIDEIAADIRSWHSRVSKKIAENTTRE